LCVAANYATNVLHTGQGVKPPGSGSDNQLQRIVFPRVGFFGSLRMIHQQGLSPRPGFVQLALAPGVGAPPVFLYLPDGRMDTLTGCTPEVLRREVARTHYWAPWCSPAPAELACPRSEGSHSHRHEIHHRGEIYLMLGMMGLEAPDV